MNDDTGLAEPSSVDTENANSADIAGSARVNGENASAIPEEANRQTPSVAAEQSKTERERLFDFLRTRFKQYILEAFSRFDGEELARFEWQLNEDRERTFAIRCNVIDQEQGAVDFSIWADDEEIDTSGFEKWGITHTNDQLKLWYEMPKRKPLKLYQYQDFQKDDGAFFCSPIDQLRRPNEMPDIGEFARLWFVDDDTSQETFVHDVTRRNSEENVLNETLSDVGPKFGDGDWKFTHPRVEVATSEEGFEITSPTDDLGRKLAAVIIGHAVWRLILQAYEQTLHDDLAFPGSKAYALKRPVNLKPDEVLAALRSEKLYFPWHVINAACTSLNAGKNVIFTGPPGCGKTKLAVKLAEMASESSPVLATASPAWNNDELIGRYLPQVEGDGLIFEPGFFLKAVNDGKWLIIDELNRANIDRAFGELFSVLAGDTAELPYQYVEETGDDGEEYSEAPKRIRIIPHDRAEDAKTSKEAFKNFHVAQDFRLLGTMNDADRSQLHQLSYALQRRFNIIRVEAPPTNEIKTLIDDKVEEFEESYGLCDNDDSHHLYLFRNFDSNHRYDYSFYDGGDGPVIPLLVHLCASEEEGEAFSNLVNERIIGIATVIDIIRFVAEGLRAPTNTTSSDDDSHRTIALPEDDDTGPKDAHNEFVQSLVAMSVALSVFPQLDAHANTVDKLLPPVQHIMETFRNGEDVDDLAVFRRIKVFDGEPSEEENGNHSSPLHILSKAGRINDYLARELALHLGGVGHDYLDGLWSALEQKKLITEHPDVV